ncbi:MULTISPECIES: hypothetical protein [Bacteroides]|uniref:hypothetical protein n=1 Tax=Bacteroides TaxID=816 RepID=UPI00319DC580
MRDKDREFILLLQGGVFFFFRLDTKEKEPKRKYLRLTLKNEAGKPCGVFVRWVWGGEALVGLWKNGDAIRYK